jgi:hypothetical protein
MPKAYIKIDEQIVNGVLGEYHIDLDSIDYQHCDGIVDDLGEFIADITDKETSDSRICSMNFTVSDGFVSQDTVLSTQTSTDLSNYKNEYGDSVVSMNLYETNIVHGSAPVSYNGMTVEDISNEFIDTYAKNAVVEITNVNDLPFTVDS